MALPFAIIQVTAAYSNAVLVAVMPHIADFSQKLNLPTKQPVTISQVASFTCSPRSDIIGGRVILTNGYTYWFDHGQVHSYESPHSYYAMQNPAFVTKLLGPVNLTQDKAVQIAHDAILKLGYTDATLAADRPPEITPPPVVRKHHVPRYRIRWLDPTRGTGGPDHLPTSVEFEINATTGTIERIELENPNTWIPDPKIGVKPPVLGGPPEPIYRGGRKVVNVSPAYANAFLAAILPECSAFAEKIGFRPGHKITIKEVDKSSYICGLVEGDPMAEVNLKDGTRFNYRHGQIVGFYAPLVMYLPGKDWPSTPHEHDEYWKKFYGPINLSTNQTIDLVKQTIEKLGYSPKILKLDESLIIAGPSWWGTNRVARCTLQWHEPNEGAILVQAEVDVADKTVMSLFINDHAITNIWRTPPKIDARLGQ